MGMRFESDQEEEELVPYDAYTALEDRKGGRKAVYFYVAAGLGLLRVATLAHCPVSSLRS